MEAQYSAAHNEQEILSFADKYLAPYKVLRKSDESAEIVPNLCPFCHGGDHEDQNTFALSVDKGVYVCKRGSCGKRGTFEQLVDYFHGETTYHRNNHQKIQPQYKVPDVKLLPPTEEIYQYFEKRKISRKTVDEYGISSDQSGTIVFPFYKNGNLTYVKYRKPKKPTPEEAKRKEWQEKDTMPILFGMDLCSFNRPLIITEGQIDAMSLYEAGIMNAVSVPSGCDNMNWIEPCYEWLDQFKSIVLFGDSDEPGRKMVQTLVKRLGEARCKVVEDYPESPRGGVCKDANEILFYHGPFELVEMVENAKEVPVRGLIDLSTVLPYDPSSVTRIKTNIPELDRCLGGLAEGGVTVFTGKAGDGKSTLSGLLLLNAIEQGFPVCAYSGELRKEKFQEWINLQCAGSDYIGLRYDPVREEDIPAISYTVQERLMDYYRGRFFLFDNNEIFEHNQSESILEVFTLAARRYGCKLFLVDNMMTSLSDVEEETRAQGRFVGALKKFANKYLVHVIIVAHPRKTKAGEQLRKDDVGGNSAIVNLADSAIVVERPNLRIIKNREGGIQRLIECCYCQDSRRIYQADRGDMNVFSWDKTGVPLASPRADSLPQYGVVLGENGPF